MNKTTTVTNLPLPSGGWICQAELAAMLGVSPRTASLWASAGKLRGYEHGFPNCGRRKYSKALVELEMQTQWNRAVDRQRDLLTLGAGGGE